LGNAKIRGIHELPACLVSELSQLGPYVLTVVLKHRIKDTPDVFDEHCAWANLIYQANHRREKITFISVPQLLSRYGKRRAWQTAGNDIDAFEASAIKLVEILLDYFPQWPIQPKSSARVLVDLYERYVVNPCLLKPK